LKIGKNSVQFNQKRDCLLFIKPLCEEYVGCSVPKKLLSTASIEQRTS